jgi:hypothetical protein
MPDATQTPLGKWKSAPRWARPCLPTPYRSTTPMSSFHSDGFSWMNCSDRDATFRQSELGLFDGGLHVLVHGLNSIGIHRS